MEIGERNNNAKDELNDGDGYRNDNNNNRTVTKISDL